MNVKLTLLTIKFLCPMDNILVKNIKTSFNLKKKKSIKFYLN